MDFFHVQPDEWREKQQQDLQDIVAAQHTALAQVIQSSDTLSQYLLGCGRLRSALTSGNAALVLQAFPDAKAAMSAAAWQSFGRGVSKNSKAISILSIQNDAFCPESVFELSQTYGNKPFSTPLLTSKNQFEKVFKALDVLSPVLTVPNSTIQQPVSFVPQEQTIFCLSDVSDEQKFYYLSGAIIQAYTEQYRPGASQLDLTMFCACAVGVELCGRFGVVPPKEHLEQLRPFLPLFERNNTRKVLEQIREFSRTMGDYIQSALSSGKDHTAALP